MCKDAFYFLHQDRALIHRSCLSCLSILHTRPIIISNNTHDDDDYDNMNYILQGQGHLSKRIQVPSAAPVQQHFQSANEHDPDDPDDRASEHDPGDPDCDFGDHCDYQHSERANDGSAFRAQCRPQKMISVPNELFPHTIQGG